MIEDKKIVIVLHIIFESTHWLQVYNITIYVCVYFVISVVQLYISIFIVWQALCYMLYYLLYIPLFLIYYYYIQCNWVLENNTSNLETTLVVCGIFNYVFYIIVSCMYAIDIKNKCFSFMWCFELHIKTESYWAYKLQS